MNEIPKGATHVGDFYGETAYYKVVKIQHMNQVSEEWETYIDWYLWVIGEWISVGRGFSSRRLKEIQK